MTTGRSSESHQQQPGPQPLQNWAGYLLNAKAEGGARGGLLKHWRNLSVFHAFPLYISFTSSFDGKTWPLVIAVLFSSTIVYHELKTTIVAIDFGLVLWPSDTSRRWIIYFFSDASASRRQGRASDVKSFSGDSHLGETLPLCETGSVPLLLESICWSGSHCRCMFKSSWRWFYKSWAAHSHQPFA